MGFNNNLDGTKPYKRLVPVGPLNAELGLISRREQLQQLNQTFAPRPGATTKLNTAVLAAYKYMIKTYDPRYSNTVVVMTGGQDDAPGDISNEELLSQVRKLNKPSHHVGLLFDVFGHSPVYPAILRLARATGGRPSTSPTRPRSTRCSSSRSAAPCPADLRIRPVPGPDSGFSDSPARCVNHLARWRVIFTRPGESGAPGLTFFRWPGCAERS